MSRRSRNSRAWRYVWSGIRRDADARALVLASESDEWGYDRQQVSVDETILTLLLMWKCLNILFLLRYHYCKHSIYLIEHCVSNALEDTLDKTHKCKPHTSHFSIESEWNIHLILDVTF